MYCPELVRQLGRNQIFLQIFVTSLQYTLAKDSLATGSKFLSLKVPSFLVFLTSYISEILLRLHVHMNFSS